MRKIDVILLGLGLFLLGGALYFVLQLVGLDQATAGIWSQAVLVGGLIVWLISYLFRVGAGKMTYHQQLKDYEEAVLQKRFEELTPEELERLQAEIAAEKHISGKGS